MALSLFSALAPAVSATVAAARSAALADLCISPPAPDGSPRRDPGHGAAMEAACGYCLLLQAGALPLPAATEPALGASCARAPRAAAALPLRPAEHRAAHRCRAPPALS